MQKPQVEDDNNKAMRKRKEGRQVPMQKPIVGRRQQQKKEREVDTYLETYRQKRTTTKQ